MTIELRVEDLVAGGDGMGRHPLDGRAVFVHGGLPGDLWRGEAQPMGRQAAKLASASRLEDGVARRAARCPSRPDCGGCNWHEFDAQAAVEAKRSILLDCLERIAGHTTDQPCQIFEPSAAAQSGRHRVGLKVIDGGLAYLEHGSHRTVPLRQCAALAPALEKVMHSLAEALPSLPPGLTSIQASLSADSQNCAARLTVEEELTPPAVRHLIQAVVRQTELDGVWIADDRGALEAGEVRLRGLISTGFGKRYRLRGGGFHQASPAVNEALVRAVVDAARPQRRQRIVDMHGGAGNFGLVLAAKGADVTISEIDRWACEDLALNVQAFKGRGQVHAAEMTGSQALLRCSRRGVVHCVVFDAPRTGDAEGAATVAKVRPQRVVALGCDPATFCRDLRTMGLGNEYRLTELGLWDAFPETHHFESMAVLERQT